MSGLLLKDMYTARKYCRSLLMIALLFGAMYVFSPENYFFSYYPVVISSMLPVTLLAYDERCHWDSYCEALPCTRTQAVAAKYIISLIATAACVLLLITFRIAFALFNGSLPVSGLPFFCALIFSVGMICPAITLPLIYKFGVEKGRIVYYIIIGAICAVTVLFTPDMLNSEAIPTKGLTAVVSLLLAAALFGLSYLLSVSIYKKKDLQ